MEKFNYEHSHVSEVIKQFPEALKWLESKEPIVGNSRYSKYKKYIDDFHKEMAPLSVLEEKFEKSNWAFQELFEIVQVYNSFKDENSNNFNQRIKKVISGQDLVPKVLEASNDNSRNFMYELLIAAYFKSKGFRIEFNDMADVVALKNSDTLYIECKRLTSPNSLEKNLKKAEKQLTLRTDKNAYGLVFIDIANCILDKINTYEYSNIYEMTKKVDDEILRYSKDNQAIITSLNDKYLHDSLGVCITFFRCLWLSNLQVNYFRKFKVQTSENISDELYKKLIYLLS